MSPSERILVLNPNSSRSVTEDIDAALAPLRFPRGPAIECATLEGAPEAIETDADVEAVAEPVREWCVARADEAGAFVVACFSDPGVALARAAIERPVFGMAECGCLAAMARGGRFGIVSILEESLERHRRQVEAYGIASRLAADLPLGLGVLDLAEEGRARSRLVEVGRRLRDEHGAGAIVLGCAGMAGHRARLESALGVPVVDPVLAAVAMALGAVRAGGRTGGEERARSTVIRPPGEWPPERRGYPRIEIAVPVKLVRENGASITARTVDVAPRGMQVHADRRDAHVLHPSGRWIQSAGAPRVYARFEVPVGDDTESIDVGCRMVHLTLLPGEGPARKAAIGLEFERFTDAGRDAFERFLSERIVPAGFT